MIFNIISIIMFVIRYLPDMIALVKKIIESIRGIKDAAERAELVADLHETIKEVKKTGQFSILDDFLKRRKISLEKA